MKYPGWLELWSIGRYFLKLQDNEFWSLTLAQLDFMVRRFNDAQQRQDWRMGMICAVVANCNRDPKKKSSPFKPEDFMPRYKREEQTTGQMLQVVRALNAAHRGKEKKKDG